ncbi:methyltransferase [Candidatus Magnetomorum sp. HK-1]|nr:methyltransferase [Candidatus Magnetomorum sp. HK-1]
MLFRQNLMQKITKTESERYTLIKTDSESNHSRFARNVKEGLTSSPKFFLECDVYDDEGSRLFEKVCQAPEYYLTRVENEILSEKSWEIVSTLPENITLVELGSGNSQKTRGMIEALLQRQTHLLYVPVDISFSILDESAKSLILEYPRLYVEGIAATYHDGLDILREKMNSAPKLILWLGSSIGHVSFKEAADFLQTVRERVMTDKDAMLIGTDLKKDRAILEAAYNDCLAANACLAKNILTRINHELGGNFIPASFDYQAVYNETESQMEISLISTKTQQVEIRSLALKTDFGEGEAVHLHNPYKYSKEDISALADNSGMKLSAQWTDPGEMFGVNLFSPKQISDRRPNRHDHGTNL